MIDILKFETRVNLLKNGHTLLMSHQIYGDYKVRMNPQQNRVYIDQDVTRDDEMTEDKIMKMLVWDCGDWYIYEQPGIEKCGCCAGKGVISTEAVLKKV